MAVDTAGEPPTDDLPTGKAPGQASDSRMGIYRQQVLPRIIDRLLSTGEVMKYRSQTVEGLHGKVVEIGFGSGLNVSLYPPEVTTVYAVDPATVGQKLAADRVAASPVDVEYIGLDGQSLPLDDESCDAALSTYTLCTIPDAALALTEVFRVLKPGAKFHLLEHGLAHEEGVVKWQRRFNPIQKRVGDGCHLDRDHRSMLTDAGFEIESLEEWYAKGPKPFASFYRGVAVKPD